MIFFLVETLFIFNQNIAQLPFGNVLTAAVIAKHSRRKISIEDVVLALMDEYHKLGKQISQELKKLKT